LRALVSDTGYVSIEIPHLLKLVAHREYDTIYHEHFSYLSLLTTQRALATAGLTVVDVEELPTHGGSLRTWSTPNANAGEPSATMRKVLADEHVAGLDTLEGHAGFSAAVADVRAELLEFLISVSRSGALVTGYGAPGKGNTLLNHCGIRSDLLAFTVDRNPFKHGKFLPGTHIPIRAPELLEQAKPDYILVLPWNLRDEIVEQLAFARAWGARFIIPIPEVTLC
jgi:C-methyltransferase C-terminal domain